MRILHILDHSAPLHSGYTFRTLSILREQRKLGWETFHMTSPKHDSGDVLDEVVDGWHFFRTPRVRSGLRLPVIDEFAQMRATESRLMELVHRVHPDILHAHSPVLNAIPAVRVGHRLKLPVVYEVRAFWEDAAVDHGTTRHGSLRYRATRALETWALRRANAVICICEGLRNDIVARGIAESKITVVPNAVDVESFPFRRTPNAELVAKLGLEGKAVVGFIGSFYDYEGLDLLIDAVPSVMRRIPNVSVLLVGGGPREPALRRQVSDLKLERVVHFVGRVPHEDIGRYYSVVDIFAYPRYSMRLTELVTPLKPLEAMAQGGVVVASDVGGHRELIRDGVTAVLFKPGSSGALADALVALFNERSRWPEIRSAGRHFVETERSWTSSVARYRPVYGPIVTRPA